MTRVLHVVTLALLTLVTACSPSPVTPTSATPAPTASTQTTTTPPAPVAASPAPAPTAAPTIRTFTLAGVVWDRSGRAVRQASVTATDSSSTPRTATTDGNGYYSIAPLREGAVRVEIAASGFVSSSSAVNLTGDVRIDTTLTEIPVPVVTAPAPSPTPSASPTPGASPSPAPGGTRIGAVCRDGWLSDATGSGACSSHGGVSCWRYSDGTCRAS